MISALRLLLLVLQFRIRSFIKFLVKCKEHSMYLRGNSVLNGRFFKNDIFHILTLYIDNDILTL